MTTSTDIQQAQQAGDLAAELAAIAGLADRAPLAHACTVSRYLDAEWGRSTGADRIALAQRVGNAAYDAAPDGERSEAYQRAFRRVMQ
jgi:hypothetical protein